MKKYPDIEIGQKFDRITILAKAEWKIRGEHWIGRCECGTLKVFFGGALKNGHTKSCGCYRHTKSALLHTKHGMSSTKEYSVWCNIKDRCFNPLNPSFYRYGGRGIVMCEEWANSFEAFFRDVGTIQSHLQIDRIDNGRGYVPGNVRLVTNMENCNNTRRNRLILVNGETHTLSEWSRVSGVKVATILQRIGAGWNTCDAVYRPPRRCSRWNAAIQSLAVGKVTA